MSTTDNPASTHESARGEPVGPAQLLGMADRDRHHASRAMTPDGRIIYTVWGVAWLVGFGLLYAATQGRVASDAMAWVGFGAMMSVALVVTLLHLARQVAGIGGPSARAGTMYGIAWPVAVTATVAVIVGLAREGMPADTAALLSTAGAGLIVGTLYLASGAICEDRAQYVLGAWILLSTAVGTLVGFPAAYLVMALGGGGGFLIGAGVIAAKHRSRR